MDISDKNISLKASLGNFSIDGDCGCFLYGENLQEGEAEFVPIKDAPKIHNDEHSKRRWAMVQAHRNLCSRIGRTIPYNKEGFEYYSNVDLSREQ